MFVLLLFKHGDTAHTAKSLNSGDVILAKAGIQFFSHPCARRTEPCWIPAFAGMTKKPLAVPENEIIL
jgi:hypothetical protein